MLLSLWSDDFAAKFGSLHLNKQRGFDCYLLPFENSVECDVPAFTAKVFNVEIYPGSNHNCWSTFFKLKLVRPMMNHSS